MNHNFVDSNNKGRLIAFGCSLTYGHGLKDCISKKNGPGPYPSKYAWPSLLADMLGRTCTNLGSPGSSNKRICQTVMSTGFKKTDVVFINWSYIGRSCIIEESNIIDLFLKGKGKLNSSFSRLSNNHDLVFMSNLYLDYISLLLEKKKIKYYHLITDKQDFVLLKNSNVLKTEMQIIRQGHNRAKDNQHPNEDAHLEFATEVYKEISEGK